MESTRSEEEMNMIPVEGHSNLYRDQSTGAIVSNDSAGYSLLALGGRIFEKPESTLSRCMIASSSLLNCLIFINHPNIWY